MARIRPAVFVGSSSEGLAIAQAVQVLLDPHAEVELWTQGVFGLSQGTLESLVLALQRFDFAVLVLTADDLLTKRGETAPVARDNVLFELGLFVGGLGRDRTFMLYNRVEKPDLPTDLAGITAATFEPHRGGNTVAALGAACYQIQERVSKLGLRDSERFREAAQTISSKTEALAVEANPAQRGRLAQEIQRVASSLGAVGNEWFRYDVQFRGLAEQFGAAFIPLVAAGTPTWREHRVKSVAPGEFVGTLFIKTGLSHNTFQRLAEQSGLIFLDVVGAAGAGTGRAPYDPNLGAAAP